MGAHRTPAKVSQVELARPRLDERSMCSFLEGELGVTGRGEKRVRRIHLVGTFDPLGTCDGHRVLPAGTSLGHHEVVGPAALVDVRALGNPEPSPTKNVP